MAATTGYDVKISTNMPTKLQVVQHLLEKYARFQPTSEGQAFAPSNIALCKYWGKRNSELNLPVTSSLSISLGSKGATTHICHHDSEHDEVYLNNIIVQANDSFSQRLSKFLDLFRPEPKTRYLIHTTMNIPVAAGLASSACGLATLILALNQLYGWELPLHALSILARLGSGSAARSLWHGFVEWHAGTAADGMDSFAEPLSTVWPELRIGLLLLNTQKKPISSRAAMQRTVETSTLYSAWPQQVARDLSELKAAIETKDFARLGAGAEHNALSMHATMLSSWPPISYLQPNTVQAMQNVWALREQSIPIYFTQDAGPNLKLLFTAQHQETIHSMFPNIEIVKPFLDQEEAPLPPDHCSTSRASS